MTTAQYITVRETSQVLGISEKKVMEMVETNQLQAFKIAGQFLRLKKADVLSLRNSGSVTRETTQYPYTISERVKDFLYFNDFYLISAVIISVLLYVIFNF